MELLVTLFIFALLATAMLASFAVLGQSVKKAREKIILSSLATNYLEIARNMPYSQVGTLEGNPSGQLPDLPNAVSQTIGPYTYDIYYKVSYVHDAADTATGTPDYKQVKMSILNTSSGQVTDFLTTVSPKGLITNPNTGALQVNVINSQGQYLQGASVTITYPTTSPYTYDLPDTSNGSGQVTEVGLPAAVNDYRIVATEPGYSTDQTYPITPQNPNPIHPDATVATGTITQLTLSIDRLANLNIKTLDSTCNALSGVNVNVTGSKLIGAATTTPPGSGLYKYSQNFSSSGGVINLNNIEWDTYTPVLLTGQPWVVFGTSPVQQVSVLPATAQTFTIILGTSPTPNNLLVIVKDASSGTALENASVTLSRGLAPLETLFTGGSVWTQNDWSGGSGASSFGTTTPNQYFQDNGNVNVTNPGSVVLNQVGGSYVTATGTLESSTFDTGTGQTDYTILTWLPSSQSASTSLAFQVAANNDNATWNYVGPDGTANTYFTTPGQDIGPSLNSNRYFRYKVFLSSQDPAKTPVLTSVAANFVTGCFTPGQVIFTGLTAGNNYSVTVSMAGYQTQSNIPLSISADQPPLTVLMSP